LTQRRKDAKEIKKIARGKTALPGPSPPCRVRCSIFLLHFFASLRLCVKALGKLLGGTLNHDDLADGMARGQTVEADIDLL
jgi:hypothetical protein